MVRRGYRGGVGGKMEAEALYGLVEALLTIAAWLTVVFVSAAIVLAFTGTEPPDPDGGE